MAVALGALGVVVPGLPTTPFLLLASWLFYRSSQRLQEWLLQSWLGKYIRNYHRHGGMTAAQKAGAVGLMVAMVALSTFVFIPKGSAARIIVPVAGAAGVLTVIFAVPNAKTESRHRLRYFLVDAFTYTPFGRNTAGVVLVRKQFPTELQMQQIAAELRFSETAFVQKLRRGEFAMRYFTPTNEVDLCGHATLAAFWVLCAEGMAWGRCLCHTRAGDIHADTGQNTMIAMTPANIVEAIENPKKLYLALA